MLKRTLTTMGLIALAATTAIADPFDAKAVPADAKWVLHVDVEALAKSSFWPIIEQKINADANLQAGLQQFEMIASMSLPQDLHSVTVYGLGFNEPDGVILFRARANQQQLTTLLQQNPSFTSIPHGNYEVLSWEDKGKIMHGAFFGTDRVIIGQSQDNVERAIDILDGKGDSFKADSVMTQPAGVIAAVSSDAIAELAKKPDQKNNPILPYISSAAISLAEQDQNVLIKAVFGAPDATKATQLKTSADGLKALGMMLANGENADPKLKLIAPLLPPLEISSQGSNVMINWSMPFTQVKAFAEQVQAARAANAPARAAKKAK